MSQIAVVYWSGTGHTQAMAEAVAKACGTGIGEGMSFQDIEIGHLESGAPVVLRPAGRFVLSISHCQEYATATAILLADEGKKDQE